VHPKDLVGKRVAVSAFQTTLSLLTKGDLRFYYDVPWEQIHWLVTTQEKVKFEPKPGVRIDFIGGREDLGRLLENGQIDAFFLPHPPHSISSGATRARRLFADCRAEEAAYYRKVGDFPIMHIIAIRQELLDKAPGIAKDLLKTFDQAWAIAKTYYDDPNWARLAWGRHDFEEERAQFVRDPWQNDFACNKANIERFIRYSQDQGLIPETYPAETLFAPSTLNT
jgi:4,5-dihydroxyphthalate decarboxylase